LYLIYTVELFGFRAKVTNASCKSYSELSITSHNDETRLSFEDASMIVSLFMFRSISWTVPPVQPEVPFAMLHPGVPDFGAVNGKRFIVINAIRSPATLFTEAWLLAVLARNPTAVEGTLEKVI